MPPSLLLVCFIRPRKPFSHIVACPASLYTSHSEPVYIFKAIKRQWHEISIDAAEGRGQIEETAGTEGDSWYRLLATGRLAQGQTGRLVCNERNCTKFRYLQRGQHIASRAGVLHT